MVKGADWCHEPAESRLEQRRDPQSAAPHAVAAQSTEGARVKEVGCDRKAPAIVRSRGTPRDAVIALGRRPPACPAPPVPSASTCRSTFALPPREAARLVQARRFLPCANVRPSGPGRVPPKPLGASRLHPACTLQGEAWDRVGR